MVLDRIHKLLSAVLLVEHDFALDGTLGLERLHALDVFSEVHVAVTHFASLV